MGIQCCNSFQCKRIMKTTFVILLAALAAVASANFEAGKTKSSELIEAQSAKKSIGIVICLVKLVLTGTVSTSSILSCVAGFGQKVVPYAAGDWNHFVHIWVVNGENLNESGTIMGSHLKYGKWQKDGADVDNVDNIQFNKNYAQFSAVAPEGNVNGAAGYFEVHEDGKPIAKVLFDVPAEGEDRITIRSLNNEYTCSDNWYYDPHFNIVITCYSLKK